MSGTILINTVTQLAPVVPNTLCKSECCSIYEHGLCRTCRVRMSDKISEANTVYMDVGYAMLLEAASTGFFWREGLPENGRVASWLNKRVTVDHHEEHCVATALSRRERRSVDSYKTFLFERKTATLDPQLQEALRCPISMQVFCDPVMLVHTDDNIDATTTYNRSSVRNVKVCPTSRRALRWTTFDGEWIPETRRNTAVADIVEAMTRITSENDPAYLSPEKWLFEQAVLASGLQLPYFHVLFKERGVVAPTTCKEFNSMISSLGVHTTGLVRQPMRSVDGGGARYLESLRNDPAVRLVATISTFFATYDCELVPKPRAAGHGCSCTGRFCDCGCARLNGSGLLGKFCVARCTTCPRTEVCPTLAAYTVLELLLQTREAFTVFEILHGFEQATKLSPELGGLVNMHKHDIDTCLQFLCLSGVEDEWYPGISAIFSLEEAHDEYLKLRPALDEECVEFRTAGTVIVSRNRSRLARTEYLQALAAREAADEAFPQKRRKRVHAVNADD